MNSKFFILFLMAWFAIIGYCLPGRAARFSTMKKSTNPEASTRPKASVKTLPPSPSQRLHPRKQKKSLPDLVVEKIWLEKGTIAFRLKNTGKGAIPDKDHKSGKVTVACGGKTQTYAFTQTLNGNPPVDPKGSLKKPGSAVTYTTGIKPVAGSKNHHIAVTVIVDSTRKIKEQNEGNNPKTVRLPVPFLKVAAKPKGKTALKAGKSKFTGGHTVSTRKSVSRTLISIEKIYLYHGTVHVRLKNSGKTRFGKEEITKTRLVITCGTRTHSWSLGHVDHGRHLRHPGSCFDFDTRLSVTKQTRVIARTAQRGRYTPPVAITLQPAEMAPPPKHGGKTYPRFSNGHIGAARGGGRPQPPNRPLPAPQPTPDGARTGSPALRAILAIKSIDISPPHPRAKHDITTIRVTVKNTGPIRLPYRCTLNLSVYPSNHNGYPISFDNVHEIISGWNLLNIPLLDPGEELNIEVTATFPEAGLHAASAHLITLPIYDTGSSTAPVYVWPENYDDELNKLFVVEEAPQPTDLVLERVTRSSDGRLQITMHNTGAYIPDQDFDVSHVKVTINDGSPRFMKLSEIDPTGLLKTGWPPFMTSPVHVTFIWPARTGMHYQDGINPADLDEHTVRVHLNFNNAIPETNIWNNIIEKHFSANPANVTEKIFAHLPDLALCAFKIVRLTKGQSCPVHLVVKNFGPGPSVVSRLHVWVEGFPIHEYTIPELASGGHYDIYHDVRYDRTGVYRFNATIDVGNSNDEVVEDNNEWDGQLFVNEPGSNIPHTEPSDFGCSNTGGGGY